MKASFLNCKRSLKKPCSPFITLLKFYIFFFYIIHFFNSIYCYYYNLSLFLCLSALHSFLALIQSSCICYFHFTFTLIEAIAVFPYSSSLLFPLLQHSFHNNYCYNTITTTKVMSPPQQQHNTTSTSTTMRIIFLTRILALLQLSPLLLMLRKFNYLYSAVFIEDSYLECGRIFIWLLFLFAITACIIVPKNTL